jgi:hypothetical protein
VSAAVVPSEAQVLHLVGRAERGVLTPAEAGLLRRWVLVLLRGAQASSGALAGEER